MRVLIVGCGYIGLPLGAELARRGHAVFGVRRSPAASAELRRSGVEPLMADVSNRASLAALPLPFDWVVNCVASSGGGAEDYRRTYLEGTRHLLDVLSSALPRRFIYTSSTGVYGQIDGSEVTEESPTEPDSATAQVLVQTERLLLAARRERRFPATILRLAGIYGPGRGYWLRQLLAGEARIEGDGGRVLNMVHRDDVVGAVIATLEGAAPGEIYNVVDDEPVTQRDFLAWLAQRFSRPMPASVPGDPSAARKRGLTSKRVSNARLRREVQYRFRFPTFREGFEAEIASPG
jgi:nucleoside-diphosphate-sugar epimerase